MILRSFWAVERWLCKSGHIARSRIFINEQCSFTKKKKAIATAENTTIPVWEIMATGPNF